MSCNHAELMVCACRQDCVQMTSLCTGTLLDTMPTHWASWEAACKKFGVAMAPQQFLHFAGLRRSPLCHCNP